VLYGFKRNLPDWQLASVPISNSTLTYLYTPRDTLRPLFDEFSVPFPAALEKVLNSSNVLAPNDTLPDGLDLTSIAIAGTLHIRSSVGIC